MKKLRTNLFTDLKKGGFSYEEMSEEESSYAIKIIKDKIDSTKEKPNHSQWNDYWSEIKENEIKIPSFFNKTKNKKTNSFYRYEGRLISSNLENFAAEIIHYNIKNTIDYIRLCAKTDIDTIIEFGCGNAHNLEFIRKQQITNNIYGCDFSKSAVEMVKENSFNAFEFDMSEPNLKKIKNLNVDMNKCVFFTSGSLEQLGKKWKKFFEFLKKSNIKYVFHIEPIKELYSKTNLIENLALEFHNKKKYLDGYFAHLKQQKHFNLIYSKSTFGTLFDQGFNTIILIKK